MIVLTSQQIRQRIARGLGDLRTGTLTSLASAGATTLVDTARAEANDHWNNAFMHVGSGPLSEDFRVTDYVNIGTFTIDHGLDGDQASGTVYDLHKLFSTEEYQSFLEMSILELSGSHVLSNLEYTANVLAQDTWEYVIPNNFKYISSVTIAESDGTYRESGEVHRELMRVVPGAIPKLRLSERVAINPGRALRIRGQGEQTLPTDIDTSEIEINPAFIIMNSQLQAQTILTDRLTGERAQFAAATVRSLTTRVENLRQLQAAEHRPTPGGLVVP